MVDGFIESRTRETQTRIAAADIGWRGKRYRGKREGE